VSCVLIDVDGTLFARPSAERSFVAYLFRHRVLGPRQVLAGLAFFLRWGLRYGLFAPHRNKAYLAGLRVSTVEGLAERFVRESLLERLRPSIVSQRPPSRVEQVPSFEHGEQRSTTSGMQMVGGSRESFQSTSQAVATQRTTSASSVGSYS
jgi:hypothetical protein